MGINTKPQAETLTIGEASHHSPISVSSISFAAISFWEAIQLWDTNSAIIIFFPQNANTSLFGAL